jgi:hypothetical protein
MSAHANRRQASRGQSLVIFALVATVLLGIVGLAVDGGFSYFASDRLERGAMAAALAGVPDMPDFNAAPNDATTTALAAAAVNGWTPGGANNVVITVAKVQDPNNASLFLNNRLQVQITSDVPVFFMRLLGFGTHRESRIAIAEYLRPITFGQPGNVLGSTVDNLGTPGNFYFMRSEGWGTDRGQGDAYGPNPSNAWSSSASAPNIDVHALSGAAETSSQPLSTMPARGGQNYQIYVPAYQTANIEVYNPSFAPDKGASSALGYNYHEDDSDFPETGSGGPANPQQWPIMSYTVYKSANPFDHQNDVWLSNMRVYSIDDTAGSTYKIPETGATNQPIAGLANWYHHWVDVQLPPAPGQEAALVDGGVPLFNGTATAGLPGGSTGATYRLRVDQLDNLSADPGANGRPQDQNSQAHKGYAVRTTGCTDTDASNTCSVTALNDVTLYTPLKSGAFSMPLVSIPPEYAGRNFYLYIYDPGDVACCSNILSVTQPVNNGTGVQVAATTTDGIWKGQHGEVAPQASWTQQVPAGNAAIQTLNGSGSNIYNGFWIRFDISVPADYASGSSGNPPDINPADPSTWFWNLNYQTQAVSSDTITANLGFAGAPVHIVSG